MKISENALFLRVKRWLLSHEGVYLSKCREDSRWFRDMGRYYGTNAQNYGAFSARNLSDLEEFARRKGLIRYGEKVVQP